MAKYKLTVVHELEDNEGVQSESELKAYVDGVVKASIGDWDKVRAELQVNDTQTYNAEQKAFDKEIIKMISMWPWHCSANGLPTEQDVHIIACQWLEEEKIWVNYDFYTFDFEKKAFVTDTMYGDFYLVPSPNVYWRTVAEPEPPKPIQHDSDR
jgi:hypothetical protein